jgi:hypothetical protein
MAAAEHGKRVSVQICGHRRQPIMAERNADQRSSARDMTTR